MKKLMFIFVFVFIAGNTLFSQELLQPEAGVSAFDRYDYIKDENSTEKIYFKTEKEALYPKGADALRNFVLSYIPSSKQALRNNKEEEIFVQFVVEKDGSLSNIKVEKNDIEASASEEIVKALQQTGKWIPAKIMNTPVRSLYLFSLII